MSLDQVVHHHRRLCALRLLAGLPNPDEEEEEDEEVAGTIEKRRTALQQASSFGFSFRGVSSAGLLMYPAADTGEPEYQNQFAKRPTDQLGSCLIVRKSAMRKLVLTVSSSMIISENCNSPFKAFRFQNLVFLDELSCVVKCTLCLCSNE